jgi:hypothetical protein
MIYDTSANIIAAACAEIGLNSVADPYISTADEQVQLRNLLNQAGRELYAMFQWQQFVKLATISTGGSPVSDGLYSLPADFGYFINQTGWVPTTTFPLRGPLTQQTYAALVATDLATSTIYVSFLVQGNQIQLLPAPAPANTTITYYYMSTNWVQVNGNPSTTASLAVNADDRIMFEPVLISKFLALRYKQAKGLEHARLEQQFQNLFSLHTSVNAPAPVLDLTGGGADFPYLDWRNVPDSGYGL